MKPDDAPAPGRPSWFFCFPKELLATTFDLSPHDFGAYWRARLWYYLNGPLPNDDELVRNIMRVSEADWPTARERILRHFHLNGDGFLHLPDADHDIGRRTDWLEKKRHQTAAARAARWPKGSVTETVTKGKGLSQAERVVLDKELDRVLARMRSITDTYSGHQTWKEQDKRDYTGLRQRRDQLRQMLGVKF